MANCRSCEAIPDALMDRLLRSSHEEQQREERAEAVREIDRDPASLDQAGEARQRLGAPRDGQVERAPEAIVGLHGIARRRIERRREVALDQEERLEDLPYRLPEAFGGVLHARRLQGKPA